MLSYGWCQTLFRLLARWRVVLEDPLAGAFEILVLPGAEAPQEGEQRTDPHQQGDRNKKQKARHCATAVRRTTGDDEALPASRSRRPLPTTTSEDVDMAIAAISGVT